MSRATIDAGSHGFPRSGGDAKGDILVGIESLSGSAHADRLAGNSARNTLAGGKGDDLLLGLSGADTFVAGSAVYGAADADRAIAELRAAAAAHAH